MKVIIYICLCLGFIISLTQTSIAYDSRVEEAAYGDMEKEEVCPIMGKKLSGRFFSEYKDELYEFCCKSCVRKFEKNPKKYLEKNVEESEEE